ncbi:MAG: hypothetical protein Q4G33_14555, partial [bacterium]|nr:hypothetical protein [bacterium]
MAKRKLKKPSDVKDFIRKLGKAALYEIANQTFYDIESKYESVLNTFYDKSTFTPNVYERTKS